MTAAHYKLDRKLLCAAEFITIFCGRVRPGVSERGMGTVRVPICALLWRSNNNYDLDDCPKVSIEIAPCSALFRTETVPRCASRIVFTMARPSPTAAVSTLLPL